MSDRTSRRPLRAATRLALALLAPLSPSCGPPVDADPPGVCSPGEVRGCVAASGCPGLERCAGDPPGWTSCHCEAPVEPAADGGAPPLPGCAFGMADPEKCGAAPRVACAPPEEEDGADEGYCRPLCVTDADCGGLYCDPRDALCADAPPAESALGAACDASSAAYGCDGVCVDLTEGYAVCSRRCVFGEAGECDAVGGDLPESGCLYASRGGTIGDVGFCAELCDCESDCAHPEAVCDPLGADLQAVFGRPGVCTAPELALSEPLGCP